MRQSSIQLQRFLDAFSKYINSFSSASFRDFLFNICSGKAALKEVANYLLNIETIGQKLRKQFISQCSISTARFEQDINKVDIRNFSSELGEKKIKIGQQIQEVGLQRNLFGNLLAISIKYQVDITEVLSYLLTPVSF